MALHSFKEPDPIDNNICIGTIGTFSILMDESGAFYYYNSTEHLLEIGEAVDSKFITSIDLLPSDERESMYQSIYELLL